MEVSLNTAALSRLADCCASSLQALTLGWHSNLFDTQPRCVALEPLARFTSLTSLSLNGVTVQAATQVLPRLTSLKALHLQVVGPSQLRPDGLMPLTALRQLTSLAIRDELGWWITRPISLTNQARGAACMWALDDTITPNCQAGHLQAQPLLCGSSCC